VRLILGYAFGRIAVGVVLGAVVFYASSRVLESQLYEVSPSDPFSALFAVAALGLVTLPACAEPSWRAARESPMSLMKAD